jgi:hypothetical protein
MRMKIKVLIILILSHAIAFFVYYGCGGDKSPGPETAAEPERQERIVFAEKGVLYYDSPDVIFAVSNTGGIAVVENGVKRLIYEPGPEEEVFPLAANPEYIYFAVESDGGTGIKRIASFNLGGEAEDYGEFSKNLAKPYFINGDGDLAFAHVDYGEDEVRLLAYELPAAELAAMSPPLPGGGVTLFPAPESDAAYAVIERTVYDADIYFFSEKGNETSLVIEGVRFEEYYLENDRAFAVISEKVSWVTPMDGDAEVKSEKGTRPPDSEPLFKTRILDLKARGSVPVYSVGEPEPMGYTPSTGNGAGNVLDGDIGTAWVVKNDDGFEGRTMRIDFARPRPIRGLKIYSDPATDNVKAIRAGRPAVVTAELSDGSAMEVNFDIGTRLAVAERDSNEPVEWVVLTVGYVPGGEEKACIINEVQLY